MGGLEETTTKGVVVVVVFASESGAAGVLAPDVDDEAGLEGFVLGLGGGLAAATLRPGMTLEDFFVGDLSFLTLFVNLEDEFPSSSLESTTRVNDDVEAESASLFLSSNSPVLPVDGSTRVPAALITVEAFRTGNGDGALVTVAATAAGFFGVARGDGGGGEVQRRLRGEGGGRDGE